MTTLWFVGKWLSENMEDENGQPVDRPFLGLTWGVTAMVVTLTFALGIPAAYLSWTSNALADWGVFFRFIFALVAFFYCVEYLLAYMVFRYDLVGTLQRVKTGHAGWFWS